MSIMPFQVPIMQLRVIYLIHLSKKFKLMYNMG